MNRTLLLVCSIVALLAVAACKRGADAALESLPPGDTGAAAPQYTKGASEHGFLMVDPGEVANCGDTALAVATVRWSVDRPAVTDLRVEVGSERGGARKLFSQGGNQGEAVTGPWVGEGVIFYLVDVATGEDLDAFVVGAKACGS